MAGLDLSGVADVIEDLLLVDDLIAFRLNDTELVLNNETLALEDHTPGVLLGDGTIADDDVRVLWTGKGAVLPYSRFEVGQDTRVLEPDPVAGNRARVVIGRDVDVAFNFGDLFRVTQINGETADPAITRRLWQVVQPPPASSFSVLRQVSVTESERIPADTPLPANTEVTP